MSRTFPSGDTNAKPNPLTPSERQFTLGTYPTKTYRSLAGTTVKRSFGNKPHSYGLRVEFKNIPDAALEQILEHYSDTEGGFNRFALPNSMFAGMDTATRARIQSPDGIKWEYAGPPAVQSVFNGISSVSISFVGELNV